MVLFETVMCFRTEQTHRAECEILFHSDIRTDLSGETVTCSSNKHLQEDISFTGATCSSLHLIYYSCISIAGLGLKLNLFMSVETLNEINFIFIIYDEI